MMGVYDADVVVVERGIRGSQATYYKILSNRFMTG